MVSFNICEGNPGALTFVMQAYEINMFGAEKGFQRMQDNGITGSRLYMLWNDCCNRDTCKAIVVMNNLPISMIKEHISGGYGTAFTEEEMKGATQ